MPTDSQVGLGQILVVGHARWLAVQLHLQRPVLLVAGQSDQPRVVDLPLLAEAASTRVELELETGRPQTGQLVLLADPAGTAGGPPLVALKHPRDPGSQRLGHARGHARFALSDSARAQRIGPSHDDQQGEGCSHRQSSFATRQPRTRPVPHCISKAPNNLRDDRQGS